jgi:sigma-B regulation protein RsbQ
MWSHVTPAFEDKYKIVLFDYVGSGLSEVSEFDRNRYSTLRGYGQDINEILDELELKNVHFVGHSVSSMIGALAFLERPDLFKTITMIGPSACYINSDDYVGGFDRADIEGLLQTLESNHVAWSATMRLSSWGIPRIPSFRMSLRLASAEWTRFWQITSPRSHSYPTTAPIL